MSARVDRSTACGNPYDMERDESQRDLVCSAFERLLLLLDIDVDGNVPSQEEVYRIGREAGVTGRIHPWSGGLLRHSIRVMRESARTSLLRLDCHCAPRRCHADALACLCEPCD